MLMKILIFAVCLYTVKANSAESSFHIVFEKCEVAHFNKDWIADMKMDCTMMNDTHFKVSGSGNLLKDMNFDEVMAIGQVYMYEGDKYVIKPHLKLTMKSCEEYTSETFGYWKEIENHGNLKGCGFHKAGMYQVKDYVPRMKIKDVAVTKEARVMLSVKLEYETAELLDLHFYVAIAPK